MHKLPHLYKNRFGVYYLRLVRAGKESKRSLRTKDFRQAKLLALAFNLELAMKTPADKPKAADFILDPDEAKRLDVIFPDGTQVKDINTDDDVRRAKELFGDRFAPAPSIELPVLSDSVAVAIAAQTQAKARKGKPFAEVVARYKKEKTLDNVARTIVAKNRMFDDFAKRIGSKPIDAYAIGDAVDYKNALIDEGGSASRINAKLSLLQDLFAYAVANGHREGPNPFEMSKVSTRSKLQ
ncbi:integrase [Burkholderia gladioli]|uniref:integrase n=1 Tax=Burkholderia gladioli TaxID=28095 RepID=UPI001F14B643|nr:integrase [Burkholderia gladioli]